MLVYFGSLFYLEGMVDQPRKAINNFCRYTSSWLLGFSLSISLSSVSKMFCGLNVGEWLLFHIGSSLLCPFIWHSSISIDSYFTFSISRRSCFFLLCFFFCSSCTAAICFACLKVVCLRMHAFMLCGVVSSLSGCVNSFVVQIFLKHKQREEIRWKRSIAPAGN